VGNHDQTITGYNYPNKIKTISGSGVIIYEDFTSLKWNNKSIVFIPFYSGKNFNDILNVHSNMEILANADYVFSHLEMKDMLYREGVRSKHGINLRKLVKPSCLIFNGHHHTREQLSNLLNVGCMLQNNYNDMGNDTGFHVLELDTGQVEFHKISDDFPKFIKVDISDIESADSCYNLLDSVS